MKVPLKKMQSEKGAALTEYGLIMAFVAIVGALLLSNTALQTAVSNAIASVIALF